VREGVGEEVEVGAGGLVAVRVGVPKSGVMVGVGVSVKGNGVFVLKGVAVTAGVLVGTFGTQSSCPAWMRVEAPMQLADWRSATVVR
jgi:hypothetical protein